MADRVEAVGTDLEQLSKTIAEMPTELGTGKTGTMTEISELLAELSRYEDFISQSGESVLQLARVVRYFNAEVDGFTDAELQARVNELAADVAGIKDHLAFEHDKVRYLQQASMGILNMQQNQIVKVFTILTAVFLPPTLVGTMYGMNFAYMPELSWKWGFPVTILLTFLSAILPLVYIKRSAGCADPHPWERSQATREDVRPPAHFSWEGGRPRPPPTARTETHAPRKETTHRDRSGARRVRQSLRDPRPPGPRASPRR